MRLHRLSCTMFHCCLATKNAYGWRIRSEGNTLFYCVTSVNVLCRKGLRSRDTGGRYGRSPLPREGTPQ